MSRDPEWPPNTHRIISYDDGLGVLDANHMKPVYAFDTDRTLGGHPMQMSASIFWEDRQLDANKEKAAGLQQLAVLNRNKKQIGSAFFISQPFQWDPELVSLFHWLGVIRHTGPNDYYILFASAGHVFENADDDKPIFTKEVYAGVNQSLVTGAGQYKLVAKPSHPRYTDVPRHLDSPSLAPAAGAMFRPMPKYKKSLLEWNGDSVIGVLRCHPSWINQENPTEGHCWFAPSGTPAEAGGNVIYATSGYPREPLKKDMSLVYGVGVEYVDEAWDDCRRLLLPNNLSLSVGDVIAVGKAQIKHRCSTSHGMCGGPVWRLDMPNTFTAIHYGSSGLDVRSNYNRAFSADADLFVLNYARFVLPVLCKARKGDWPHTYTMEEITKYLLRHQDLLQRHTLWSNAEAFFKAQGVDVSGTRHTIPHQ